MEVTALNCQCCGGVLKVTSSVCVCEYCGGTNIICGGTGKYIDMLNRANSLRQRCDFDRAYEIYDEILTTNPPFADILWSQTLCEYGIEYVEDPVSKKYLPTLHRIKDESILANPLYLEALELCDEEQKKKLEKSAEEIYKIQVEYLNIAANEKPYDVFICYKETDDETEKQTKDSVLAEQLYNSLKDLGYKVFFSRITLKTKLGIEFEPYIFAALKSALVMVVFGTQKDYFEATWVRNEWSRFLRLKEYDTRKQIFFACNDVDDLPKAFSLKQAQILTEDNAIENLVNNVNSYFVRLKDEMVDVKCPNCKWIQKVNPLKETALCTRCKKPYVVSEAVKVATELSFRKKSWIKCPYCGREQERNIYGCIYCHKTI
ncbi:MAG: toll/interleukin-1 receptor domain-containing protein [Lachnospiraceae bacterium]|nr:toll/interleukin-1 receptor domain-containing protein [Lachnospiraceae bacterium]